MAQIAVTGTSGAQFVETPMFTLDVADIGKTITVSLDYSTSGTFSAGDCTIQIINYSSTGTYQAMITPSITNLPSTLSFFQTSFTGTSTASDQYSIRFLSNNAALRTFNIDSLEVSSSQLAIGTPIGPWLTYTPTFSAGFGTVTNILGFYRRIGDTMEIRMTWTNGTVAASLATITIPTPYTIDTTKTVTSTPEVVGGYAGGVGMVAGWCLTQPGTSTSLLYIGAEFVNNGVFVAQNVSSTFNSATNASLNARIPISQWSTQTTLATSSTEFASNSSTSDANDTTSFVNGASGNIVPGSLTAARKKRVQFNTAIQPTDNIQIEIQYAGAGPWVPIFTYSTDDAVQGLVNQNGLYYGVGLSPVSGISNQIDVQFGQYAGATGATYGAAGYAWGTVNGLGSRWRVRKSSGIGVGELAPATVSSAGYVNGQSGWVAYTPTLTNFGTATNISAFYRRIGDSLDIRGYFTCGTVVAGPAEIGFPSGLVLDTTRIPSPTNTTIAPLPGYGAPSGGAASTTFLPAVVTSVTGSIVFWGSSTSGLGAINASSMLNNTNNFAFCASGIPIVGWS